MLGWPSLILVKAIYGRITLPSMGTSSLSVFLSAKKSDANRTIMGYNPQRISISSFSEDKVYPFMSNPGQSNQAPITSRMQLVEALSRGCKAASEWKIGTEHEKFGFTFPDAARAGRALYSPPPYRPEGIEELLKSCEGPDWKPILDQGNLIGLTGKGPHKGSSLSLEPAGQFELSGAPLKTLHDTKEEMDAHFEQTRISAALLGIGFAPLGFHPLCTRDEMPWMPKSRYAIMRRYMPGVGTRGLDMMTRTAPCRSIWISPVRLIWRVKCVFR